MTDLEIMYLLEENGYEPSFENVRIFKENNELLNEKARFGMIANNNGNNLVLKYRASDITVENLVKDYLNYKNLTGRQVNVAYLRSAARDDSRCEEIREKIKEEIADPDQNKKRVDSLRNAYFAALDRLWTKESKELRDSKNKKYVIKEAAYGKILDTGITTEKTKGISNNLLSKYKGTKTYEYNDVATGWRHLSNKNNIYGSYDFKKKKGIDMNGDEYIRQNVNVLSSKTEFSSLFGSVSGTSAEYEAALASLGELGVIAAVVILGTVIISKVVKANTRKKLLGNVKDPKKYLELIYKEANKNSDVIRLRNSIKDCMSKISKEKTAEAKANNKQLNKKMDEDFKELKKIMRGIKNKVKIDVLDDTENKNIEESFSDYELYQILEKNGYETSVDNLDILKEGLETGELTIE